MLKIYIGHMPDELGYANGWFDNQLDTKYYVTDFSKDVIKRIDNSEVVNKNMVNSPVLGGIPITKISTGSKALIVINYTDKVVNLVSMGDNCLDILSEMALSRDIVVSTARYVDMYSHGYTGEILILNDNSKVSDRFNYLSKHEQFIRSAI